ncbi:protein ROOT PRIMORDIUM DEFECTIVE 1 [Macadamia integrifolia]|uniref:protein ROOT PRIMORDIUM DEFECTIVE 1 n=1 Tax=Macadamia integrifolia TaxID=60698 RepID=UPI001C52CA0E|nr:protein ROOT PRIMORDIUM DEFECTIVE 1 [Macadamia integrifolia]
MLGSLFSSHKIRTSESLQWVILQSVSSPLSKDVIGFGPFNLNTQKRWKKPVVSARTRLEDRTRDLRLDKLMSQLKRLKIVLKLQELILNRRGPYVSLQLLSRWKNIVGLNVGPGVFIQKYPHIFQIFTHPLKRNLCCKLTPKMLNLIKEETKVIKESELMAVQRLKKLLMMTTNGTLHIYALRLVRRELGLPEDFRDSILLKYPDDFRLVDLEIVALVSRNENLAVAEVEKWREKEYREKWLSEFETRYAFQINFPTGFKIEKGFREKLKNWQRLPYLKPYETKDVVRINTCGGIERFEKRAVGILHELLCLTIEKMVELERLSHFRRDFGIEINVRELLLKHPGIFYISTKGSNQTVFLREAYCKGCLMEPNPIYTVRREMLDLLLLGCRNTRELQPLNEMKDGHNNMVCNAVEEGPRDGDWVIPILESFNDQKHGGDSHDISNTCEVDLDELQ